MKDDKTNVLRASGSKGSGPDVLGGYTYEIRICSIKILAIDLTALWTRECARQLRRKRCFGSRLLVLNTVCGVDILGGKWLPETPVRDLVRNTAGRGEMCASALASLHGLAGRGRNTSDHGG